MLPSSDAGDGRDELIDILRGKPGAWGKFVRSWAHQHGAVSEEHGRDDVGSGPILQHGAADASDTRVADTRPLWIVGLALLTLPLLVAMRGLRRIT